jgi:hypothetical protein
VGLGVGVLTERIIRCFTGYGRKTNAVKASGGLQQARLATLTFPSPVPFGSVAHASGGAIQRVFYFRSVTSWRMKPGKRDDQDASGQPLRACPPCDARRRA